MGGLMAVKNITLFFLLSVAAWTDLKDMRIPNRLIEAGVFGRGIIVVFECKIMGTTFLSYSVRELAGSVVLTVGLFCLALLSRSAMGLGDVKLLGIISLYQGVGQALGCFVYGILLAGGICIRLLLAGRIGRRDRIPLAPFFFAGYVLQLWL